MISYRYTNDILESDMQMNLASRMSSPSKSDIEPSFTNKKEVKSSQKICLK